ncbi:MAG TPA: tetratricopeptide repeat protein [Gemmatimonadales bacterium]|nr:tetratricopeptide repeat protein [Gemmatimonadales bacterium]
MSRLAGVCVWTLAWLATAGCAERGADRLPAGVEAISLLGDTLRAPPLSDSVRQAREAELADARAVLEREPNSADALIWVGRRLAYLGRYRDAVAVFSDGIERFANDARFYRHRGHRYITLRQFDRAIHDFERAADLVAGTPDEVEPDGQPNARGIPTSTLQFNIWYHLGLAYYLKGDFENALRSYRQCLAVSNNPDAVVATSHWLYMTLRRLGRSAEAAQLLEPIAPDMDIIENDAYHRLLLMYKGIFPPDSLYRPTGSGEVSLQDVTTAYGVGNWHLYNEHPAEADLVFRAIVAGRNQWAAFGYIAAEAELARSAVER